jgi:hypothetical protein
MSAIVTPIKRFDSGGVGGPFNVELLRTYHALDVPKSILGSGNGGTNYVIELIYTNYTRQVVTFASSTLRNTGLTNLHTAASGTAIATA